MRKEDKDEVINGLAELISRNNNNFYVVDSSTLTVNQINVLRRLCHEEGITLQVVKNSLIQKALERLDIKEDMSRVLAGPSSMMFAENPTAPAKLIKAFRKKFPKPVLKAAYIQESLYVGDENLDSLLLIKSKEQLLGELIGLLNSPIQKVLGGLQGGGHKIAGILKTLSEKEA